MFSIGLSEIVLIVKDVTASAQFYETVVGLTPDREGNVSGKWAWFWAGTTGQAQRVGVTNDTQGLPRLPEGQRWGQVHYAFHVPREKLEAAAEHVRGKGVKVSGPHNFEWMKAIAYTFHDPDGNLLEFWSPESA